MRISSACPFYFHEPGQDRPAYHPQGQAEAFARNHHRRRARHVGVGNALEQIGKTMALAVAEMDDAERFVGQRHIARNERVGGIHQRHALDIDIGQAELGNDVMDVVVHATQDGFHRFFGRASAIFAVAVDLLYPLQVDGRRHADQQVHMLGHIDALASRATVYFRRKVARVDFTTRPGVGHQAAMLTLVEQKVAARLQWRPGRELASLHPQILAVLGRMRILANHPAAAFAIGPEKRFQLREMIALRPKPGNLAAAAPRFLQQGGELPIGITSETVAMNDRRFDVQALENELERVAYRGQTGSGRTGHSDDGILPGHGCLFPQMGQKAAEEKV